MIYEIDGKYYLKRNRKFIRVNVTFKGDDADITAKSSEIIEDNGDLNYREISLNEIKKLSEKDSKKESHNKVI